MNKAPMAKRVPKEIPRIGEKGTKHHILVDGRGVPLSVVVTGANRHDVSQLQAVLESKIAKPIMESESENLCADAGYAGEAPRKVILAAGYEPLVRSRGEEQREKVETLLTKHADGSLRPAILGSTGSAS